MGRQGQGGAEAGSRSIAEQKRKAREQEQREKARKSFEKIANEHSNVWLPVNINQIQRNN